MKNNSCEKKSWYFSSKFCRLSQIGIILKKIIVFLSLVTLFFCLLVFITFFDFFRAIIFGGRVEIINTTTESFFGKIDFFQHRHFLHRENFTILQNEKKNFSVPDEFNDGEIKIVIENQNGKQEFILKEDYLYSVFVDEKIVITKENENIEIESDKNPYF